MATFMLQSNTALIFLGSQGAEEDKHKDCGLVIYWEPWDFLTTLKLLFSCDVTGLSFLPEGMSTTGVDGLLQYPSEDTTDTW